MYKRILLTMLCVMAFGVIFSGWASLINGDDTEFLLSFPLLFALTVPIFCVRKIWS